MWFVKDKSKICVKGNRICTNLSDVNVGISDLPFVWNKNFKYLASHLDILR